MYDSENYKHFTRLFINQSDVISKIISENLCDILASYFIYCNSFVIRIFDILPALICTPLLLAALISIIALNKRFRRFTIEVMMKVKHKINKIYNEKVLSICPPLSKCIINDGPIVVNANRKSNCW